MIKPVAWLYAILILFKEERKRNEMDRLIKTLLIANRVLY